MKRYIFSFFLIIALTNSRAQTLDIVSVKFHAGDVHEWKTVRFNDYSWPTVDLNKDLEEQGHPLKKEYGYYRIHFIPHKQSFKGKNFKYGLNFNLGDIEDCDETYLNGQLIGKTGSFPSDKKGFEGAWNVQRIYNVTGASKNLHWDKENLLVVKIYNEINRAGHYGEPIQLFIPNDIMDGVQMKLLQTSFGENSQFKVILNNLFNYTGQGKLTLTYVNPETQQTLQTESRQVKLKQKGCTEETFTVKNQPGASVTVNYQDQLSGKEKTRSQIIKYILTPPIPAEPHINNALVYGVTPGKPVILRLAVTGERPMHFQIENLPAGLTLDSVKGVVSGAIQEEGDYPITLKASNESGQDKRQVTIKVGRKIALTPPMGWNSWNCWGLSVSQQKVMASAQALIDKRLADCGYTYMNIDDAWEGMQRKPDGSITFNQKFTDMKALGDWLHSNGLKFGVYSSPGDITCGFYPGSLDHEEQDAETYSSWGIDYLKYDWCGYYKVYEKTNDKSAASFVRPYLKMEECLRKQPRDIFYGVCWGGALDSWRWAYGVDANSWRTTDDIADTWDCIASIANQQAELYSFSMPGHWNDPDMLIVGKLGWGSELHDSPLTADEQYTHISLWTLLAANLLIGCDISQMDDFTLNLLCNNEVNAIDQDILGKQARREVQEGDLQIWKRPLYDGSYAVGIFNMGQHTLKVDFSQYFSKLGIQQLQSVRDLWRQKNLSVSETTYSIPSHGVRYLKITY